MTYYFKHPTLSLKHKIRNNYYKKFTPTQKPVFNSLMTTTPKTTIAFYAPYHQTKISQKQTFKTFLTTFEQNTQSIVKRLTSSNTTFKKTTKFIKNLV